MDKIAAFIGAIVLALISDAATALLRGFFLMLAVDVANNHWVPQLPNLGYWSACLIAFLVSGALPFASGKSKK